MAAKTPTQPKEGYKGASTMSKCRYGELKEKLNATNIDPEQTKQFLEILCEVLKFDETVNMYELKKSKLKDGESTYMKCHKDYYERNKAELNKKRLDRRDKKKVMELQEC